ncbi:4-hydroxybenzoate octaprenyltransferase [Bowmanella sp. JS7-9]|uniref:4-hydroxybenzoate octaprenyltransferase n=1 Tax=Pseudobowmanella zhangzhouensis TaxID=1537679 RepID=A0ABW1XSP7_9ALTE|nr:4-hydroxybenzoate octaprenyltransferase [Bowmanella sp. JS7-9]
MSQFNAYWRLMRADKPIGTYLLLWPTYWALWIAAGGWPGWPLFVVFTLGVVVMRAAGCVINDYADRHVDGAVERTAQRPLATGEVSEKGALRLFAGLIALAFMLVLQLNLATIALSVVALGLAASYPFMKRYTHLPQVVLGAAFSWAIPMAFMATNEQLGLVAWLLFAANLLWTVAYDTQYAMVDRDDDILIGIKSTAILFGRFDVVIISVLQLLTLLLLIAVGELLALSGWYYLGVAGMAILFGYQYGLIYQRQRQACFKAFLNNHYAGLLVAVGIMLHYLFV